jgi:hypothetical protein
MAILAALRVLGQADDRMAAPRPVAGLVDEPAGTAAASAGASTPGG